MNWEVWDMTLKTSSFNKGLYVSTIKRFAPGALLYFVLLFVSTGLALFLDVGYSLSEDPAAYFRSHPLILEGTYFFFPIMLAMVVPSISALLVFRFLHTKKQAIFMGSLPITRGAAFFSSFLAGFTLMLMPVLLNGGLLMLFSLCGYSAYFTITDCLLWISYNALCIFLLYSCATFSATLCGNGFAAVGINILLHAFLSIAAETLGVLAGAFLYGYADAHSVLSGLSTKNFIYFALQLANSPGAETLSEAPLVLYLLAAILLYVVSYSLALRRRPETAGDVAAFRVLRPIFKYIITFLATLFGFAIFASYMEESVAAFAVILVLISLIVYAACEMVLRKTTRVLYAWKGYAGFAAIFLGLVLFLSQTTFFGYETRVPEKSEVAAVAVYNYYRTDEEPFVSDAAALDQALTLHKTLISPEYGRPHLAGSRFSPDETRLHLKYKLQNGKILHRIYSLPRAACTSIMNTFYEIPAFKMKNELVFTDKRTVLSATLNGDIPIQNHDALLLALQADVMALPYEKLYPYREKPTLSENTYTIHIEFRVPLDNSDTLRYRSPILRTLYLEITSNYEHTLRFLKDSGYIPSA